MRHLPVIFKKIALIGLLASAVLPLSYVLAQGSNQPGVIEHTKLAACVNRFGQKMVHDRVATAPFAIRVEVSGDVASDQRAKMISDPATAACIELLAQDFVRYGTARAPFVILVTAVR